MNPPPIELLEATHTFPCIYTFKVIGDAKLLTEQLVTVQIQKIIHQPLSHSSRSTSGGNHIAVTLEVPVASAVQVHQVYHELFKMQGLVLVL